jgi:hypothetical protein
MAAALMRRGLALARDYARRREAFGAALVRQPLHADTLAGLQAESEAAFHLSFQLVELIGRDEAGELDEPGRLLLRALTSITKLTTGRQAVDVLGEVAEAFGGAGYVEDTGIPALLRDAHVLPIWEGTTNVLALDTLRALGGDGWAALVAHVEQLLAAARDERLCRAAETARAALASVGRWLHSGRTQDQAHQEAGARRLALPAGRALALALLVRHAQWSLEHERDARARAAALRFAATPVDLIAAIDAGESAALAEDEPLPA